MEYWDSFQISPKILRQMVDNFGVIKKILDDSEKCKLFFNHFPYDQFFNFTTMDGSNVMLCVKILDVFANYDEFCNYDDRVNYALEFILLNLSHVNNDNGDGCGEIIYLLQLLSKILDKNISSINSSFKNVFDRERILELMLKLTNLKSVQKSSFKFYSEIMVRVVDLNFSDSLNPLLSGLFEKFTEHKMVKEQVVVCRLILRCQNKIFSEFFKNVWTWLVNGCPNILAQSTDVSLLKDVIYCFLKFTKDWSEKDNVRIQIRSILLQRIQDLYENLSKITSYICLHTHNPELRSECHKLLKFIVSLFVNSGNVTGFEQEVNAIENLPEDVEKWPKSDTDLFFCICHICVINNSFVWKKTDVLFAIMRCFYSRRHIIKPFVLKSIYYLYPILTRDFEVDVKIVTLGDDLLNYFTRLCSVSYLYSYNSDQLKWMLDRAPPFAKMTVLTHWVKAIDKDQTLEDALTSTIQSCQAEKLLLKLMVDNLGTDLGLKSAMLLRRVQNDEVSSIITLFLPFTMEKSINMYNLLLAEPNTSTDTTQSIQICSLMGIVIATVTDALILRSACKFSCKLLTTHKNDPRALQGFCKNISNIRHIICVSGKVDDDTSVEIIRLLKVLILVQKRNQFKPEHRLKEDFRVFIRGSTEKIKKSLWLLYHSLVYKYSLITLDLRNVMEIYHLLLDFGLNSIYQDLAYRCIVILLKRMPWLAQTISSSVYVEMVCLSFSDAAFKKNVFRMLNVWLRLVRQEMHNGFCPVPETAIRSFIMRGDIKSAKMQEYLKLLDELLRRQNRDANRNVFLLYK